MGVILLNFKNECHFHFFLLKGVGGAESLLAMNHCKIPNIYWKYWNCFENLEFLIPPVGRETWWVKNWRQQWWRRRECKEVPWLCSWAMVCPHTAAAAVGEGKMGPAKQPWLNWKPAGLCPGHLIAWFWGAFLFVFFCCVKEEKESRKRDPFSNWLTHTLWDKSWTPTPERGLGPAGPELKAPEKNQMLPTQRKLTFLACWPITSCGTYTITITTAFFSKRDTYSVSLSSFNWNDTI